MNVIEAIKKTVEQIKAWSDRKTANLVTAEEVQAMIEEANAPTYTVNLVVDDGGGRGVYVSTTKPESESDYDFSSSDYASSIGDGGGHSWTNQTATLTEVRKLYYWLREDVGVNLKISKNGEIIFQSGYGGVNSFANIENNFIDITEDCTITINAEDY